MKRKRHLNYLFMAILYLALLTGCAGLADYTIDLPGDYSVIRTSAHNVTIAPQIGEDHWGSNVIPTKVTEVAWNDMYILVKQLALKDDPKSSNGYQVPDNQNVYYWILECETGEVTGPLDEEGFKEKRVELQIADDIVLKNVEGMRKQ